MATRILIIAVLLLAGFLPGASALIAQSKIQETVLPPQTGAESTPPVPHVSPGDNTKADFDPNTPPPKLPDVRPEPNAVLVDLIGPGESKKLTQPINNRANLKPFWQRPYHPQVNERIYALLSYPYYPTGPSYITSPPPTNEENTPTIPVLAEPNNTASGNTQPLLTGGKIIDPAKPDNMLYALQECCDLIHQWRQINEAPDTALEIVYAVELTRTATGIYQLNPDLAVAVKRTVGQLGQLNHKFDITSRATLQNLLQGQYDKRLSARLDKQINDIKTLLNRLAEQNEQISVALGIGRIKRPLLSCDKEEKIDFSQAALAISTSKIIQSQ